MTALFRALVLGHIRNNPLRTAVTVFAVALGVAIALAIDLANGSILSAKVAAILPLGGSSYAIVIVTGLVGALVGGGSALTAAFLKKAS